MNVTTAQRNLLQNIWDNDQVTTKGRSLVVARQLVAKRLVTLDDADCRITSQGMQETYKVASITPEGMDVLYPVIWILADTHTVSHATVTIEVADGEDFFRIIFNGEITTVSYDDSVSGYIGESAERAYDWLV